MVHAHKLSVCGKKKKKDTIKSRDSPWINQLKEENFSSSFRTYSLSLNIILMRMVIVFSTPKEIRSYELEGIVCLNFL